MYEVGWVRQGQRLWALPGRYPFPHLRSGLAMATVVPRLGVRAAVRLPSMIAVDRVHPPEPHWYLLTIGVEPAMQGRGVAATLIGARISEADATRVPIYLETFNPANPTYYRRLGFTDRQTVEIRRLPRFWTMLREPATAVPAPQE